MTDPAVLLQVTATLGETGARDENCFEP
jgi:hypothetical protein